jgi:RHS repeat-associated protein
VTSAELVAALPQIAPYVVEHGLETRSGETAPQLVAEPRAAAVTAGGDVLLSTGLAADAGLGDTDLASDGERDFTSFWMVLEVPAWARSLRFRTALVSAEVSAGAARRDDHADLTLARDDLGTAATLVTLQRASQSFQPSAPWRSSALQVVGGTRLRVGFLVLDVGDGRQDSALRLRDAFFSDDDAPPEPIPPDDQFLHGDATPYDALYGGKINLATGALRLRRRALLVPASELAFDLRLIYDSARAEEETSPLGPGWTHSYDWHIQELQSTGEVRVVRGDGSADYFVPAGSSYAPRFAGVYTTLGPAPGGGFVHRTREGEARTFDLEGRLVHIDTPRGSAVTLKHGPLGVEELHDTRGNSATFEHDGAGRLCAIDYAGLARAEVMYDAEGRLVALRAPGVDDVYAYDAAGNMTSVRDGGALLLSNVWHGGRLVQQLDGDRREVDVDYVGAEATVVVDGHAETTTLDAAQHPIGWLDHLGHFWGKKLGLAHEVTERRDPLGNVTRITWDGDGNPLRQVDPLGREVRLAYDAAGNLTTLVDQAGHETHYEWNTSDQVTGRRTPLDTWIRYAYDAEGRVTEVTDLAGRPSRLTYSEAGDLASVTDPLGGVTRFRYDDLGRLVQVRDARDNLSTVEYDGSSRRTSATIDALGNHSRVGFDAQGRVVEEEDALGNLTAYAYDSNGDLIRVVDRNANTTVLEYDSRGNIVRRRAPLERTTSFVHDDKGQLVGVLDAEGGRTSVKYDAAGNRTGQSDPLGNRVQFEYDASGQMVRVVDPTGAVERRAYDVRGQLESVIDARGVEQRFVYDAAARLVRMTVPSEAYDLTRDPNGNALTVAWAGGTQTIHREFDALDRVVLRRDAAGNEVRYTYDANGNLTRLTYPDGRAVSYSYDALDRLERVEDWAGRWVTYAYDAVGNLTHEARFDGSFVEAEYDAGQRLTGLRDVVGGQPIYATELVLDAAGRRISEELTLPLEPNLELALDLGARRFGYGTDNRLIALGEFTSFEYDGAGNLRAGTLDGAQPVAFEYDDLNRLVRIGDDRFHYDGDGLRVEATVAGETRRFVQDPHGPRSRLLEEQSEGGEPLVRHVYGLGLLWSESVSSGDLAVHHFDARGSTVAVTDGAGRVTDRVAYGPYGEVLAREGDTPLRFTYVGREGVEDDGRGLFHMRTRAYAAPLMRFLQRDDLSKGRVDDSPTLNRYAYVGGNPIQRIDPGGDFWGAHILVGAIVGAVVNVAVEVASDLAQDGKLNKSWKDYAGAAAEGAVSGAITAINPSSLLLGAAGAAIGTGVKNWIKGNDIEAGVLESALIGAALAPLSKPIGKALQKLQIKALHSKIARYGATPSLQWTKVTLEIKAIMSADSLIAQILQELPEASIEKLNECAIRYDFSKHLGAKPNGREIINEYLECN